MQSLVTRERSNLMHCRSLALILFALISGVACGAEPAPSVPAVKVAPALSDVQKQEKTSLLDKKLEELKRLQAEIQQLRDDLDEQQQIGLELQVIEVNETKLRNLGFDVANIKKLGFGRGNDAAGFYAALCKNNLAKIIAEPKASTPSASQKTFLANDGTKTGVQFDCTPTILDSGKIRLATRFEVSRMGGENVGRLRVRCGETTLEVEPGCYNLIAGGSTALTTPGGEKQELSLLFFVKATPSKK